MEFYEKRNGKVRKSKPVLVCTLDKGGSELLRVFKTSKVGKVYNQYVGQLGPRVVGGDFCVISEIIQNSVSMDPICRLMRYAIQKRNRANGIVFTGIQITGLNGAAGAAGGATIEEVTTGDGAGAQEDTEDVVMREAVNMTTNGQVMQTVNQTMVRNTQSTYPALPSNATPAQYKGMLTQIEGIQKRADERKHKQNLEIQDKEFNYELTKIDKCHLHEQAMAKTNNAVKIAEEITIRARLKREQIETTNENSLKIAKIQQEAEEQKTEREKLKLQTAKFSFRQVKMQLALEKLRREPAVVTRSPTITPVRESPGVLPESPVPAPSTSSGPALATLTLSRESSPVVSIPSHAVAPLPNLVVCEQEHNDTMPIATAYPVDPNDNTGTWVEAVPRLPIIFKLPANNANVQTPDQYGSFITGGPPAPAEGPGKDAVDPVLELQSMTFTQAIQNNGRLVQENVRKAGGQVDEWMAYFGMFGDEISVSRIVHFFYPCTGADAHFRLEVIRESQALVDDNVPFLKNLQNSRGDAKEKGYRPCHKYDIKRYVDAMYHEAVLKRKNVGDGLIFGRGK